MTTTYPGTLDAFTNPAATDVLKSATVPHAAQHDNLNDAVKAVETILGVNPQGASVDVVTRLGLLAPKASPTFTGIITSDGTDTSSGAAVTSPAVTSGVAFTPSATRNAQVIFQIAGITGSFSITYGPSTGAENALATAVPTLLGVGDVVDFMVPKGWKVVITLTTVTLSGTKVTTF